MILIPKGELTISVTGTINVGVVSVLGLVLDVLYRSALARERYTTDAQQWRW